MKLQGRVAIVTGGGRGIGRAIALALGHAGAAVSVADIDWPSAQDTAGAVSANGGRATTMMVDIRRAADRDAMVERTVAAFGRLDILVNNAAVIGDMPALELSEDEWDRVLDVNLKALFFCAQAAAKVMVTSGGGVIVNFSSLSAEIPEPDCLHYGVSKAGVAHLTKSLAVALGPRNIRVVSLAPGTIRTPMSADFLAQPRVEAERVRHIALCRIGMPDEIADAVTFLVSDDARYVTGSTLYVDGGQLLLR